MRKRKYKKCLIMKSAIRNFSSLVFRRRRGKGKEFPDKEFSVRKKVDSEKFQPRTFQFFMILMALTGSFEIESKTCEEKLGKFE